MWLQQTEKQDVYVQHRDKTWQSGFILAVAFIFHSTVRNFSSHTGIFVKRKNQRKER